MMTQEKAMEICEQHAIAMDETPQKVVDLIFNEFPYGLSIAQINILLEDIKELLEHKALIPKIYE